MVEAPLKSIQGSPLNSNSRDIVKSHFSNELVFGVVGFAGSGTSTIANQLSELLKSENLHGGPFSTHIIKTRDLLEPLPFNNNSNYEKIDERNINSVVNLQRLGNQLREKRHDLAAAAVLLVDKIRQKRAEDIKINYSKDTLIMPDGRRRSYILDSIKHPAEVELFRRIYGNAFCLVGVVCDERVKQKRLRRKYSQSGEDQIDDFMKNDAKSTHPFGQRVEKTFYLADFYIDNSEEQINDEGSANEFWNVPDELSRLIKIVTYAEIVRPRASEVAMYFADCARLSSSCLSRQVGAVLMDGKGNLVATGANEVPRAGGGVYGESFTEDPKDYRCAFHPSTDKRHCHSNVHQGKIVRELSKKLQETFPNLSKNPDQIEAILIESSIGGLLEFSRAIHAEMDAILSASRQGVSPRGARLFVTTFPCHYCARHIVTAGVDEVQFIEPYPKSKALDLHDDAITTRRGPDWKPPSAGGTKVLFTPFVGVAPLLYRRAFMKDRDLKEDSTGNRQIGEPEWGGPWDTIKLSYAALELEITKIWR